MSNKPKAILRKIFKILFWIIGSIIGLFLLIVILLQLPPVQDFARGKLVTFLEEKIKTPVKITKIELSLPKKLVLRGVYFESREKDTLLAGDKLAVDISLFKLLDNTVEINSIDLRGITANIIRTKDSVFNFDYIIDAFASDEPKDKDSKPMKITVNRINLDNIRMRYSDAITKNDVRFRMKHFDTEFDRFDLDAMDFDIPEINLKGLQLMLDQGLVEQIAVTSVKVADTVSKRPDFKLKLGEIAFSDINIGYDNAGTHLNTGVKFRKLRLSFNAIDVPAQNIDVKKFELADFNGNLRFSKFDKPIKTPDADTTAIKQKGWRVKVDGVDVENVAFKFDDDNSPKVASGIDYKHLNIKNFKLKAKDLQYSETVIRGKIADFSVIDHSGLNIEKLETDFFYGQKGAHLKNLYLKTPRTLLRDKIAVAYPSLENIGKDIGRMTVDASIDDSRVGFRDILIFVPGLKNTNPFKDNPDAVLMIDSRITGKVSDIRFPQLRISGIGSTVVDARGRITGLPDTKNAYFDIVINNLKTTAKDVNGFLPAGTLPANMKLPADISLSGTFKGSINNFDTNLKLVSSYGNATVDALFDQRTKDREKYHVDIDLVNFDIGELIGNDSLGRVTFTADVEGTGLNPKTANATLKALVEKAEFNRYTYRDLKVNGQISRGNFDVTAGMNDPNLTFGLDANGGFGGKYPNAQVRFNVDIADLQRLNLHAGPMKLRGNLDADIADADPDFLNGEVNLYHIQILADDDPIVLDTIKLSAVSTAERNTIRLKSQFANAVADGKFKLTELPTAIKNSVAKYYDTAPGSKKVATSPQRVEFELSVNDDPLLFKIVPQITGLEPIKITGRYNSENDTISLNGSIPRIVYGSNTLTGGTIKIDGDGEKLAYYIDIDAVQTGDMMLPFTSLSGEIKENIITYDLRIRDSKKKDQYALAGTMESKDGNTELRLDPASLLLNYDSWNIPENNLLRFGPNGIYADNFELSREGNVLKVQSVSDSPNAPLAVTFTDFRIETITNMIRNGKPLATGLLNGEVELRNLKTNPVFTSDLNIAELKYMDQPVGDIALKVNNERADTFAAEVKITGFDNQVNLNGFYYAEAKRFDLNLDMDRLNIETVQAFTSENIKEGKGYLSGDFKIRGTVENPDVNGTLKFNDVAMRVTQLNSYFKDINESVVVNDRGIFFDTFKVSDEKDNDLVVNGAVLTSDFKDYRFDLTVDADNFRAVNSKAKDNDLYYGDLFLDAALVVKGTSDSPEISGRVKINEDTKFSVVLPQSDPSIADREGIVEFVDEDNQFLKETEIIKNELDKTEFQGVDVNVTIQIDKEATLSLIIDKGNGDYLNLQGEAELTGGIDKSGKTTLTGKYEFTEGAYEMTFNLLKRRFDIKPGSFIIWNGEPTAANIDITAIYKVDAAPIDLVDDQLAGMSQSIRNTYKQKIPFETHLKMTGQLLRPVITFDIVLPEKNYNVSNEIVNTSRAKLEQLRQEPSELNKQVFALLLLNRFIGENPFSSEAGSGGAESIARQSASKILSDQLNTIAGDMIKGVELNFDLETTEDYTQGRKQNRTDLNVGVSKRLLNDRLKVSIGSSFGLEGQEQQNEQATNIAGDIAADYQLTPDGRYMVRAYRKNEYQVALQGQVVETGVSFIVTMDYNKFRELFHRSEEEKEMKRKERERKREKKAKEKREKEEQKSDANEKDDE